MRLYSAASGADLTGFAWLAALADRELAARTGRRLLARARHLLPIWLLPMRLRDLAARRRGLPHLFTADQSQAGADGPDWLSALVRACPPNGPDAAALAELRTPVIIS